METRKEIKLIQSNEDLNHTGNVLINFDVGDNAKINITSGSLHIKGDVMDGAEINLSSGKNSGTRIIISNGVLQPGSYFSEYSSSPMQPTSLLIEGKVGNNVVINSDTSIEIRGKIGNFCKIISSDKEVTTADVGENTEVSAYGALSVAIVGSKSKLKSNYGTVTTGSLWGSVSVVAKKFLKINGSVLSDCYLESEGEGVSVSRFMDKNTTIIAYGDISVSDVGRESKLTSQYGKIISDNIHAASRITAKKLIQVKGLVDDNCYLQSEGEGVTAIKLHESVTVIAYSNIKVNNVGSNSTLTSHYGHITTSNVQELVTITASKSINISGDVGYKCQVKSEGSEVKAGKIGQSVIVNAYGNINVQDVDSNSTLTSQYGQITTANVQEMITITASKSINISGDVGNKCQVISEGSDVKAGKLGKTVSVKAYNDICVNDVGSDSSLISQYGKLTAFEVGNKVKIDAKKEVNLNKTGNECDMTSEGSNVQVQQNVGSNIRINAYNAITIGVGECLINSMNVTNLSLANDCTLTSLYGGITLKGNAGENIQLISNHSVVAKDVGVNSSIKSSSGSVTTNYIGAKSKISAYKDITVDKSSPHTIELTAQYGKIRKEDQSQYRVISNHLPLSNFNATQTSVEDDWDSDLRLAMELSKNEYMERQRSPYSGVYHEEKQPVMVTPVTNLNSQFSQAASLSNQGIFSASSDRQSQEMTVEIPPSFFCPITLQVMEDPVICSDGNSYEREAIIQSLQKRPISPLTNQSMSPDLMFPNRALKDAIIDFKSKNPQLFKQDDKICKLGNV